MQNLASIAPLVILFPSIGAFINFFWGARLGERFSAIIGSVASGLSFLVTLVLWLYLNGNYYQPAIVTPPILDGWMRIPSAALEIPWQLRIDTLSVTMMLFVTFVGTLIHIYASGYMHGDARFSRFFAYLNMFLAFMLTLITGNNLLMMFVGWEGVGLCSYLLIGFWWDKPRGEGWKNSNAARKAFIANRVGDFGVLMAIFLTFWTFGTLDFYKPGEVTNPHAMEVLQSGGGHGEDAGHGTEEGGHGEGTETEEDHSSIILVAQEDHGEGEGEHGEEDTHSESGVGGEHAQEGEHGEEEAHGAAIEHVDNHHLTYADLGAFGKAEVLVHLAEGSEEEIEVTGIEGLSPTVSFGAFEADIHTVLTLITLFMLLGAAGKSAQIPLFVWLPDAMAGPTPVSALIHAATMVTAGVYMMVRSNTFFYHAEFTSFVVTMIGATTAIMAGFIAMGQFDIKRVLAYSTISQLGFMVAAVGVGAYGAAMFHMITHAFFKALLFLGSGSVIHGMEHGHHHVEHGHGHGHDDHTHDAHDHAPHTDAAVPHEHGNEPAGHDAHGHGAHGHDAHGHVVHEYPDVEPVYVPPAFDPQDMRNMGGLRHRMPITFWTYLIGTLALAGIWPFAGFWSKDEILADALSFGATGADQFFRGIHGYLAFGILLGAAGFTAFYMWRQIEMVFFGKARTEAAEHAPESVPAMTIPLIILAFFSVTVGFINLPSGPLADVFSLGILPAIFGHHSLATFLEFSVAHMHIGTFSPLIALGALAVGIVAIWTARTIYGNNQSVTEDGKDRLTTGPKPFGPAGRPLFNAANARLWWDETYDRLFIRPFRAISRFLANTVDWNFWHDYFHDTVIFKGFNAVGQLLSQPFDLGIIDGAVNGVGRLVRGASGVLRRSQTGYVRVYAVVLLLGVVAVIVLMLLPMLQG